MSIDVRPDHLAIIEGILKKYVPDRRVVAFGSRVKWTAKDTSDLDLCIMGDTPLSMETLAHIRDDLSESDIPYKVDIIDWTSITPSFQKIIKRDMVPLNGFAISQIANIIGGGTPKTTNAKYWNGNIPWLSVVDFNNNNRWVYSTEKTITQSGLDNSSTKILKKGQLIISARGTVGALAQLGRDMAFNQSCYGLDAIEGRAINDYLYYAIKNSISDIRRNTHGAVFDTITRQTFDHIIIPCPSIEKQQSIAAVLSALDKKIDINQQTNKTLEAMAQALFKSWFVDFEPVRSKMERRTLYGVNADIAALFPNKLVDSPLGKIPKGWEATDLARLATLNPEAWSKKNHPDVVKYVDLTNTKWGEIESTQTYKWDDAPSRAQRVVIKGDTIVGTVRPGNGSYAYIEEDGMTASTGFAVLRPIHSIYKEFVYLAATGKENIERLSHLADGGAYPAVRPEVVLATSAVFAGDNILDAFSKILSPTFNRIALNRAENRVLSDMRDNLLPKLISGELRVDDPSKKVA